MESMDCAASDEENQNSGNSNPWKYTIEQKILFYLPNYNDVNSDDYLLYDGKILNIITLTQSSMVDLDDDDDDEEVSAARYVVQLINANEVLTQIIPEDLILEYNLQNILLQQNLLAKYKQKSLSKTNSIHKTIDISTNHSDEIVSKCKTNPKNRKIQRLGNKTQLQLQTRQCVYNYWNYNKKQIQKNRRIIENPAIPNVVQILEDYVKHFGWQQFTNWTRRLFVSQSNSRQKYTDSITDEEIGESFARLYGRLKTVQNNARHVLDLFDKYFYTSLLYEGEDKILQLQYAMGDKYTYFPSRISNLNFQQYSIIYGSEFSKYKMCIQDYIRVVKNWSLLIKPAEEKESITSIVTQLKPSLVFGIAHLMRIWDHNVIPQAELKNIHGFLNNLMKFIVHEKYMLNTKYAIKVMTLKEKVEASLRTATDDELLDM